MNFSLTNIFFLCTLLLLAAFFCSCSILRKPYSKELSSINDKTCADLKRLYDMECIGIGIGLDHTDINKKVKNLYINFSVKKITDLKGARKLVLSSLDVFMNHIAENKTFLEKYAEDDFDEGNIKFSIIFLAPDGKAVLDPYICVVSSSNYDLYYNTNDPENPNRYKTEFGETIEEARKKAAEG